MQITYSYKILFYFTQLRAPWFHSCNRPPTKIIVTIAPRIEIVIFLLDSVKTPSGSNRASSISKIRKIKVIIKNRSEKGLRAFLNGENPHSKGVLFSRSFLLFSLNTKASIIIRNEIRVEMIIIGKIVNINFLTSRWMCIKIVIQRQRNVNTRLRLLNQSGGI